MVLSWLLPFYQLMMLAAVNSPKHPERQQYRQQTSTQAVSPSWQSETDDQSGSCPPPGFCGQWASVPYSRSKSERIVAPRSSSLIVVVLRQNHLHDPCLSPSIAFVNNLGHVCPLQMTLLRQPTDTLTRSFCTVRVNLSTPTG